MYSMNRTQWFKDSWPHFVGVYQVRFVGGIVRYAYWDGEYWGMSGECPDEAYFSREYKVSLRSQRQWRGLAKKP